MIVVVAQLSVLSRTSDACPGCCCFKRKRRGEVVVAGNIEADFERSLVVGVGYLGRGGICRGGDFLLRIRSVDSSAAGLHRVSELWPSGVCFDINT